MADPVELNVEIKAVAESMVMNAAFWLINLHVIHATARNPDNRVSEGS